MRWKRLQNYETDGLACLLQAGSDKAHFILFTRTQAKFKYGAGWRSNEVIIGNVCFLILSTYLAG